MFALSGPTVVELVANKYGSRVTISTKLRVKEELSEKQGELKEKKKCQDLRTDNPWHTCRIIFKGNLLGQVESEIASLRMEDISI